MLPYDVRRILWEAQSGNLPYLYIRDPRQVYQGVIWARGIAKVAWWRKRQGLHCDKSVIRQWGLFGGVRESSEAGERRRRAAQRAAQSA